MKTRNKRNKRFTITIIAVIMALTLVFALALAGCGDLGGGDDPAPDDTGDPIGTETPTATPDTTPPPTAKCSVGDLVEFGGVVWRVLDVQDGEALLLSEYVLEHRQYALEEYDEDGRVIWPNPSWETCTLRAYLNGKFLTRFSADDRAMIVGKRIKNSDCPWTWNEWTSNPGGHTPGGNDTDDKVFILSAEEVARYFGDSGQLANQPKNVQVQNDEGEFYTDNQQYISDQYDEARIAYCPGGCTNWSHDPSPFEDTGVRDMSAWWWLRSPGAFDIYASFVGSSGSIYLYGEWPFDDTIGVRPALWLDLSADVTVVAPTAPGATPGPTAPPTQTPPDAAEAAILAVLKSEATFNEWVWSDGETVEVETLLSEWLADTFEDGYGFSIAWFAVVDMDGDGTPEVVVETDGVGLKLVFHYWNGTVYGRLFSERGMRDLKKDGSFDASNGWDSTYILKLGFDEGHCYEYALAWCADGKYYLGDTDSDFITEERFLGLLAEQDAKLGADWYPFDAGSVDSFFGAVWFGAVWGIAHG